MEVKKMIESQISALQQDIAESLAKIEGLSKNIDIYTPLEIIQRLKGSFALQNLQGPCRRQSRGEYL